MHSLKLKLYTIICVLGIGVGYAWGEEADFTQQNYSNQQEISSYTGTGFSISFSKGTNNNAPKYYTSGTAIRLYGGNTFTVSATTKMITKVELTFGSSDGSNAITTNPDSYDSGVWTGNAKSVTFTIGGTSGNRRLSKVTITLSEAASDDNDGGDENSDKGSIVFNESFSQSTGTAGWSGNVAAGTIKYDNEGWTVENGSGNGGSAKFGTAKALGHATTPEIDCKSATTATLTFKSGAWSGNSESTTLKLSYVNCTSSTSSVTLKKGEWSDYTVELTNITGTIKIKFEGNAATNSRFFLDDVVVTTSGSGEGVSLL